MQKEVYLDSLITPTVFALNIKASTEIPYTACKTFNSCNEISLRLSPKTSIKISREISISLAKRLQSLSLSFFSISSGRFITRCPSSCKPVKRSLSTSKDLLTTMNGIFLSLLTYPLRPSKDGSALISTTLIFFDSSRSVTLRIPSSPIFQASFNFLTTSQTSSSEATSISLTGFAKEGTQPQISSISRYLSMISRISSFIASTSFNPILAFFRNSILLIANCDSLKK